MYQKVMIKLLSLHDQFFIFRNMTQKRPIIWAMLLNSFLNDSTLEIFIIALLATAIVDKKQSDIAFASLKSQ